MYWQAEGGGGGAVTAGGPWPREWETFRIEPVRPTVGSGVPGFARVRVITARGLFVFVGDDGVLVATQWPAPPPAGQPEAYLEWMRSVMDLSLRSVFQIELQPAGTAELGHLGAFALRAHNGLYVCAENSGGGPLVANRAAVGPWETFVADFHPEPAGYCRRVRLRCADGRHFVSAFGGGGQGLSSTAVTVGDWETFDLVAADQASGGFPANARVHLRTTSRHYLQAVNGGGAEVTGGGPWPREWETFTLVLPPGVPQLEDGTPFGLETYTGSFVSAVGQAPVVTATATRMGAAETFTNTADPDPGQPVQGTQGEGGVAVTVTPVPPTSSAVEGATADERVGEFVCSVTPVTVTEAFSDAMLLDPLTDVVWPGSMIDGLRWANGEYTPVVHPRAPLTLSLSVESLTGARVSATIPAPSNATVREALNSVRGGLVGEPLPARIQASVEQVYSAEQLQVALQAGYSGLLGKLKAKFDFSSSSVTNKYVWRVQQVYYTVDVDPPTEPSGWYAPALDPAPGDMYVASVSYGRMLLFTLETTADKTTVDASLEYAKGKTVSASLKTKYDTVLNTSRMNVVILGGDTGLAEKVITGGVTGIKPYLETGGTFGPATPAVPLSYRLRFATDNALGYIGLTTRYTRRHCMRATGRFQVENLHLRVTVVSDDSPDIELFGTVWVSGGITGITDNVPISPTGEVWRRPSRHYITLRTDQETPATISPVLTFTDIHRHFDRCYIRVWASLYDYDTFSANDNLRGGPFHVWLRDLDPDREYEFPCEGDGNRVWVHFKIRALE